ncbi:MAG: Trk system potassium transporter TrkA [Oscillospiraceae bacterium]|jgi:trk system potassium uptake protein TrkA|nr:Trk system potassium transporter TrkA [Oscillospiraceae bacterium]
MKIVIIGGGQLGAEIVASLSSESYDLSLIELDPAIVATLGDTYDILAIHGNGASRKTLIEAGVAKADLVVAVADSDEQNMLTCLAAKKLGAAHTIARVRDPDYFAQLDFFADDLGLSLCVNPEESAAREIAQVLRLPGAQKVERFADGKVELVELQLAEGSKADGVYLRDFSGVFEAKALICAVKRDGVVTIPDGSFMLKSGDRVSVVAATSELERLFHTTGQERRRVRKVMISGQGACSYYLAQLLSEEKLQVTVIERDPEECRTLAEALPKVRVVCGDGSDQDFLREEDLASFDALAVLTYDDEDNIIVAMYAESLGVPNVAIRLGRKALLPIAERVVTGTVVNPALTAASHIIRYVRSLNGSPGGSIESFHKIVGGSVEALEFYAWRESKVVGIPLKSLKIKKGILVTCIIRGNNSGETVIPGGDDSIRAGDRVIVVTASHKLVGLDDIIGK